VTVEKGFLALYCDGKCSEDEYQEPEFLDEGFQYENDLRKFAAERGWVNVKPSGRPWGDGEDYCPRCKPEAPAKSENTVEVRG
jgi:hypothetical protein